MRWGGSLRKISEALQHNRLIGWRCALCGRTSPAPFVRCSSCHGRKIEEVDLPPRGKVVAVTLQTFGPEEFLNEAPYAYVLVELENGVRVPGWIPFISKPEDLPLGTRVRLSGGYRPGIPFEVER